MVSETKTRRKNKNKKRVVAMLLAGGQGSRLQDLTKTVAKPAVQFGGKYRIIDFPLSNCTNSGISTVGVLTQYKPLELNSYLGNGQPWDLDRMNGGLTILPPYMKEHDGEWYKGTANAIYQNINYIEQYDPDYVLILSADHIYKMDYRKIIKFHKENNADLTISTINVPMEEASRFGILNTNADNSVVEFLEKPEKPISTKASMGIYVFDWNILREYLSTDEKDAKSENDFGKDIIPKLINDQKSVFAYPFEGYWKDVGTISSLWEANMDLIYNEKLFDLSNPLWRIYCKHYELMPQYISSTAKLANSMVAEGASIRGEIKNSIIASDVLIEEGAYIENSVIMTGVIVKRNTKIYNSIIAENVTVMENSIIGAQKDVKTAVVAKDKLEITIISKDSFDGDTRKIK